MLSQFSTEQLAAEIKRRETNPGWFIRELVADGYDCDSEAFAAATAWMDDYQLRRED